MVRELADGGMAVVWSTAYLEEAETCDEVILLHEGSLLFSGKPADLTGRLTGRCLHLHGVEGRRRQALSRMLRLPEVADGAIQGHSLRVILREGATRPAPAELGLPGAPQWKEVTPRFEDAFIDLLGGGPGGESVLAASLPARQENGADLIVAGAFGHSRTREWIFGGVTRDLLTARRCAACLATEG